MYVISRRSRSNPQLVGAKAHNLFRLARRFRVPEFVVISTRAHSEYSRAGEIPVVLKQEIRKTLSDFLSMGKVAVRSSCTAEDLAGVSFAGMYTTVLNVEDVDEGLDAVVEVWQSVQSPRVEEYCRQMGMRPGHMAVIIQHQLTPQTSGVMVTQSPFSISEVLIECCEGMGDKLVSGAVTPTRYRIRNGKTIEQKGADLLPAHRLEELVAAGKKIERAMGSAQDIEWAVESGRLYILQSRPVVVHAAARRSKGKVWCNANVRETIPDPISPMTWSVFDTSFFPGIMIDVFGFPITEEQYRQFRPVEMLSGRLYWNMNNTLAYGKSISPILDFIKGDQAIDPQMAAAFRSVDMQNLPRILSAPRMFLFSITALVRLLYYLALSFIRYGWMSKKIARVNVDIETYCADFEPSEDLTVAVGKVRNWMRVVLKRFARKYFGGIFLGGFHLALLSVLLSIRMGKKGEALARKTIIGIIDKTGEMAISINRLARCAREKLPAVNVSALKKLYKYDQEFRASIDRFMNDYGHRGPAEFDVASINWREDYTMLYSIITTARESSEYRVQREKIVNEVMQSVRPFERYVLKTFMPRLEAFIPLRENGKHYYLKATAKTKDQLLSIGKRLVESGYMRKPRDVFFLTLRDLDGIASGSHAKRDVQAIIDQRKKQWHEYRCAEVPDIIYESGERITTAVRKSNALVGEPLSSGKIKARARIISDFSKIHRLKQGEILVTHHADPGWTPLFTIASGLIIEVGGVICHAAMVARELGVPALSVTGATSVIPDGSIVELDADEGTVVIL
jgi:phosphohistidine swiveling domain-containing protein